MASLLDRIEPRTFPAPDSIRWNGGLLNHTTLSFWEKTHYYAVQIFHIIKELAQACYDWICCSETPSLLLELELEEEVPLPFEPAEVDLADVLPPHVGFSGSMFQDSGLGSRYSATPGLNGQCQWDPHLTSKHIDGVPENREDRHFNDFFLNFEDLRPYIQILRDTGAKAYRFSFEWSVIQEGPGEPYNEKAIALHRKWIRLLQENGIEPYITLHHFTHPLWFQTLGAFRDEENLEHYKQYALDMMALFPEVKHWYTFNEIGAFTLECLLQDHPSTIHTIDQAGRMIRNMLIAHCQIYQEAKRREVAASIGLTHQWLKLSGINQNPLENAVCSIATKITHWAIYNFFLTGQFTFQVPFQSNLHFSVPNDVLLENNRFLDHIGLQFYGPAYVILGSNGGKAYPGHRIHNFCFKPLGIGLSFGGTCPEGNGVMSFGPTVDPQALTANLEEAKALGRPIHISELGCDAKTQQHGKSQFELNEQRQLEIFQQYASVLEPFKNDISAFFVWTLHTSRGRDRRGRLRPAQLEWNRGSKTALGVCKIRKDRYRRIVGYSLRPLGKYLRNTYLRVNAHRAAADRDQDQ